MLVVERHAVLDATRTLLSARTGGMPFSGGDEMIRIETILYPTDFSSSSNQPYFHAVSLAEKHGARLTVLFVYNADMVTTPCNPTTEEDARLYWQTQLESIRP